MISEIIDIHKGKKISMTKIFCGRIAQFFYRDNIWMYISHYIKGGDNIYHSFWVMVKTLFSS